MIRMDTYISSKIKISTSFAVFVFRIFGRLSPLLQTLSLCHDWMCIGLRMILPLKMQTKPVISQHKRHRASIDSCWISTILNHVKRKQYILGTQQRSMVNLGRFVIMCISCAINPLCVLAFNPPLEGGLLVKPPPWWIGEAPWFGTCTGAMRKGGHGPPAVLLLEVRVGLGDYAWRSTSHLFGMVVPPTSSNHP